jgi:hypothetical protein
MQLRRDALEAVSKAEKDRSTAQLTSVLAWLGLDTVPHCGQGYQDNLRDRLVEDCCDGTTEWILKHPRMRGWLQNGRGQPVLWLNGKPGSGNHSRRSSHSLDNMLNVNTGKSTLCAKIIQFLRLSRQSTILFCFYSYIISGVYSDPVVFILATLVSQIIRQHIDLAAYVYDEFVAEARPLSVRHLQELMFNLLPQLNLPRILIDGIDECIRYDAYGKPCDLTPVKEVLAAILQFEKPAHGSTPPKILLISRDILQVVAQLAKKPTVALDRESGALTADIRRFTNQRLCHIRERFEGLVGLEDILHEVGNSIVSRSQGSSLYIPRHYNITSYDIVKSWTSHTLNW